MQDASTSIPAPDATPIRSIAQLMEDFRDGLQGERITLDQIVHAFHERGIGILLFFLAAPMALPIPVPPGVNVLLASPLVLLTAQQAMGAHTVWLPRRMRDKGVSARKLSTLMAALIPWLHRLEILIKPRLGSLTRGPAAQLCGVLGLLMALTVCIPVPLTNTIPSIGIALMAAGIVMRDGLAVIAGIVIGTAWIGVLAFAVLAFGPEAFDIIKEFIKSLV